jgi:hypothetical protein
MKPGELIIRRLGNMTGPPFIVRADPVVLITTEVIDEIADHPSEYASLECVADRWRIGAILRIHAANRNVVLPPYWLGFPDQAVHGRVA